MPKNLLFFQLRYFAIVQFVVLVQLVHWMKQIASTYSDTMAKIENPKLFFIAFECYNSRVLGSIFIY
jgi:hypothetical protein